MKNRLSIVRIDDCELISGHGQACFPEHTHRSFTLVLIMSGHPEITVNGKTVVAEAGTAVVLPPDNCISIRSESLYDYRSLVLHDGMCGMVMNKMSAQPCVFGDDGSLAGLFADFEEASSMEVFTDRLIAILQQHAPLEKAVKRQIDVVEKARKYIEDHAMDGLSISEVASYLEVTTGYLSRIFKKCMNITPKQYLIQCRLREAKIEMPKETGDADIAYDTGFASQSHLCTVFKKYMGITVDDYRNIVRKK